jgi:hypothetical protein
MSSAFQRPRSEPVICRAYCAIAWDARLEEMERRVTIEPYAAFALPHYGERDSVHDAAHIERIIARLDEFAAGVEPAPRADRLFFLASFHGLAPRVRDDDHFREEVDGLLRSLGWTAEEISAAFAALERHCDDPQTPEEWIVHDANAVELLGAFGIAKSFMKGGAERQGYNETLAIFERNLNRVDFCTPRGRELADKGRNYARSFIARLRDELGQ